MIEKTKAKKNGGTVPPSFHGWGRLLPERRTSLGNPHLVTECHWISANRGRKNPPCGDTAERKT